MKQFCLCVVMALAVEWGLVSGQTPGAHIVKLDPALDEIVSTGAKVEVLKDDYFGMIATPLWMQDGQTGYLLFSDPAANVIYKWTPDGTLSVFLERSGFTGADISKVGSQVSNGRLYFFYVGSSGLTLDRQGRLVFAATGDRNVVRLEKDGTRTVLADRYEGKRLNSPLEVVYKSNGALYITDGTSALRGRDSNPTKELPFEGVYLLKDGKLHLVIEDGGSGIGLSPDEKRLYNGGGRKVMRYDIQQDDTVTNGGVFIDWAANIDRVPTWGPRVGVKTDQKGNVYATGPGGVWIFTPAGKHLGTIPTPEGAVNLAFGDADGKGLYMVSRRSLYRIRVNVPGSRP